MVRAVGVVLVTLAMGVACQSATTSVALQTMRVVTPSLDATTLVVPDTPQHVAQGTAQSFAVNAYAGYTVSSLVGGTCPAGSWTQNVYETGTVETDCTVIFTSVRKTLHVTPMGSHVTVTPATDVAVLSGAGQAFTVVADAGYTLSSRVDGTCPAGTWGGATYTMDDIDVDCTVSFSAAPVYFLVTPSMAT